MSDNTYENMFYVFVSVLTIYPIIQLLWGKFKWYLKLLILIGIGLFWFVAIKVKSIDDAKNKHAAEKIDSLGTSMNLLKEAKKTDSLNRIADSTDNAEFKKKLEKDFHIKDSAGRPTKVYINKVGTLNM